MKKIKASLALAAILLSASAFAEGNMQPLTSPVKAAAGWEVTVHDDITKMAYSTDGGAFEAICTGVSCGVFIEPASSCIPGANYPVLINSSRRVGVVPTRCAMIQDEAAESGVRYVAMFREQNAVLQAMLEEMDISLAFPTQGGDMNVIDVTMTGVRKMLESVLPSLPIPAPSEAQSDEVIRNL